MKPGRKGNHLEEKLDLVYSRYANHKTKKQLRSNARKAGQIFSQISDSLGAESGKTVNCCRDYVTKRH